MTRPRLPVTRTVVHQQLFALFDGVGDAYQRVQPKARPLLCEMTLPLVGDRNVPVARLARGAHALVDVLVGEARGSARPDVLLVSDNLVKRLANLVGAT